MKRRIMLSIALVLSIGILSLTASDSTAKAQAGVWVTVGFFEVDAPRQTVQVDTARGTYNAVFQSEVQVRNGSADGVLMLRPVNARHSGGINVALADGSVRFLHDGTVAAVRLRGRTADGDRIVVMIFPAQSQNTFRVFVLGNGPDIGATWEANGSLTVVR